MNFDVKSGYVLMVGDVAWPIPEGNGTYSFRVVYWDDPILMTYTIPAALPHLSTADTEELNRLLLLVFKADVDGACKWLRDRSGVFNCSPIDLLKRDELGVLRVISYLRDAAP